ncbi:MAG: DUF4416 family protein [Syntrophobacter sp.]
MSRPREPMPAKLVIRFLFSDSAVQAEVLRRLESLFGPMDYLSAPGPFPYTNYYDREMGKDLRRQTAAYAELIAPIALADAKLRTNELEKDFLHEGGRRVNIDPGILSEERFVLATGKNFTHRIYLREGIYADLTLMFQKGAYRSLPWTYPDYREPEFIHLLGVLRKKLRFQYDGVLPVT